MRLLVVFLLAGVVGSVWAQKVSIGVKAGLPLNDALHTARFGLTEGFSSAPRRYTVGAMAELRLPFRLGIEVDALYRPLEYRSTLGEDTHGQVNTATTGNAWQFPVLVRRRLWSGPLTPYVAGGGVWQHLTGLRQIQQLAPSLGGLTIRGDRPEELARRSTGGIVVAGGLELPAGVMRIAPEVRFTRWGRESFLHWTGALRSNSNQWEFLVGFTF